MKENWRNLWTVALGLEPGMDILSPLPAALFLYFWVLFTGFILHTFTKMVVPHPLKGYLLDFIKTMTFCTYPFGHGIMRKFFGEPGYMLAMTPVVTVTALLLREGAGNPLDVWISYLNKIIPLWKCLLKNSLQILAGFSAYHLGMLVISVEFSPEYVVILKQYYNQFCLSDLNVPIYLGLLIEFAAVVYDTWFSVQRLFKIPILDLLVKVINGGLLVVSGVHLTGMYMHPAMATGHTWGCGSTPKSAHILIYWVGPFVGAWLALQVNKRFTLNLYGPSKKAKPEVQSSKTENGTLNNNTSVRKRNKRRFYNS